MKLVKSFNFTRGETSKLTGNFARGEKKTTARLSILKSVYPCFVEVRYFFDFRSAKPPYLPVYYVRSV